jgi:propanol-preferring alcohol dehydrogenase
MRAMQLLQHQRAEEYPLELLEVPEPNPGLGQVRVRVHVCGVCHTDLHLVEGDIHPPVLPIIPGHQVIGVIDAIGEGVTNLDIGNRVGLPWFYSSCGECWFCNSGMENICQNARFTGFHVNGGFAEALLGEAKFVLPIPDTIGDLQAAPLLCAGIIGYRSLCKADLKPGERLGLFGFGASAHLAIQVANYWDCEVFVFTRSLKHREHALELGATWVGGADDSPPSLLDRAVIFAPSGKIVPKALEKLRPAGTLAINAIHMSPIPEMSYKLIYGERTLRSVANATYQDGVEFLQLAAKIPVQATVQLYELEDANEALLNVKNSQLNGEALLKISKKFAP